MATQQKDPDDFSEEESITANLRLQSVSPTSRTLIGLFGLIPPPWRGPVSIVVIVILAYVLIKAGPPAIQWLRQ